MTSREDMRVILNTFSGMKQDNLTTDVFWSVLGTLGGFAHNEIGRDQSLSLAQLCFLADMPPSVCDMIAVTDAHALWAHGHFHNCPSGECFLSPGGQWTLNLSPLEWLPLCLWVSTHHPFSITALLSCVAPLPPRCESDLDLIYGTMKPRRL